MTARKDGKPKRQRSGNGVWRRAFLASLAKWGNVMHACRAAKCDRGLVYHTRAKDPEFAAKWDAAVVEAGEALELEATRRAMKGSDTLIIFRLKALYPEKYRERFGVEHSGGIELTPTHILQAGKDLDAIESQKPVGLLGGQRNGTH